MKKRTLIILAASITLANCLIAYFILRDDPNKVGLGERYDSDKVVMFSYGGTYNNDYQDEFRKVYQSYIKAASETQFVVHEKTAIAIAEAVIKEIYPDEVYKVLSLSSYPKALYYEEGDCWEVWLFKGASRMSAIRVYIDVNSGAVKAAIPSTEF